MDANSGKVSARAEVPFNVPDKVVTGSVAKPPRRRSVRNRAGRNSRQPAAPSCRAAHHSTVVVPKISTTTVSRGDSLWRLSQLTYGAGTRYAIIYKANKEQIRNPNMIYPGQIFVMPSK